MGFIDFLVMYFSWIRKYIMQEYHVRIRSITFRIYIKCSFSAPCYAETLE